MKKSKLIAGILISLAGIVSLIVALVFDTKLDGMLFTSAGFGVTYGLLTLREYYREYSYWSSPENRERYQEMLEAEKDERKLRLKEKTGRYVYNLGLLILCGSIIVFIALDRLEIMDAKPLNIYLCAFLIVQIIAEEVIFRYLSKK